MEMHEKLKELTDKIQREGFEKANEEAARILEDAKKEAEHIKEQANKEAAAIVEEAKNEANKLGEKITSEVKLASRQALLQLKKEISEMIQASVISEPVREAFQDPAFVKAMLEAIVKNWKSADQSGGLEVFLPEDKLKETEEYFREKAAELMGKGLSFKTNASVEHGFEIQPKDGHFKISMTDETFESFIKEHFKPVTIEFLYGENNK